MENADIEIGDVENYTSNKDGGFSHQALVMKAMTKAIDSSSKEMKAGWFSNRIDKQGNQVRVYEEDTRLSFISSVESCLMVMACDIDEEAQNELNLLFDSKNKLKEDMIKQEDKEWESLHPVIKQKMVSQGKGNLKGYLDKDKRFYQMYIEECVNIYREIFKVLTKQTKRLDYYASVGWEA